jgi:hypothetical protein
MLTVDRLLAYPNFLPLLQDHLRRTMDRYTELHQILRFLDSQEKWLLAFIIYRQWVNGTVRDGTGLVYMSGIWDEVKAIGGFSRNTVTAFVDGLVAYGFIRRVTNERDRRYQELHFSEVVHRAFLFWYMNHAQTLDLLDGGDRATRLQADPGLVLALHPPLVESLLRENMWRGVPTDIDVFFRIKNGYLVLDHLMGQLDLSGGEEDAYCAGLATRTDLMQLFHIGRSTLYRLFTAMEEEGIARSEPTAAGTLIWLKRDFVARVCRWQAAKFARIDHAFAQLERV